MDNIKFNFRIKYESEKEAEEMKKALMTQLRSLPIHEFGGAEWGIRASGVVGASREGGERGNSGDGGSEGDKGLKDSERCFTGKFRIQRIRRSRPGM